MKLGFRAYRPPDDVECLALFDENCPAFFAPNERDDYQAFLREDLSRYEVCVIDDHVVGAFGVFLEAKGLALRWILLSPNVQGKGIGSAIMSRVLEVVRGHGGAVLHIAASHKSAPFFAKFGAQEVATTPDGFGPGMHRVDMVLKA
ncbi:MAG: GNAT family N-acetyltransferase [Gemmatimonadaceae bacterium]